MCGIQKLSLANIAIVSRKTSIFDSRNTFVFQPKKHNVMRERTRLHHDLVDYAMLETEERFKDSNPMERS